MLENPLFLMVLQVCINIQEIGHGKTVANATGISNFDDKNFLLVDIPGTYSLMSHSEEEEIARDYICFGNPNATVVIVDATCLERNLNLVYQTLEITPNVVVCVNLLDEAKKKGIVVDLEELEKKLGVPVVGTIARKPKTLKKLMEKVKGICNLSIETNPHKITYSSVIEESIEMLIPIVEKIIPKNKKYLSRWICLKLIDGDEKIIKSIEKSLNIDLINNTDIVLKLLTINSLLENNDIKDCDSYRDNIVSSIVFEAETVAKDVCTYRNKGYNLRDRKIDKILTSKKFGIPIMLLFLGLIFWLTIVGANYPSQMLSTFFRWIQGKLVCLFDICKAPKWLSGLLIDGIYSTLTWVIAVMLPPMAIFFPLFTLLEDLGYLPRISFNLDKYFKKACSSGKQALTMCMGFGCNAAGVIGARIINSPKEKLIAILTNAFVPCNGRFPILITVATIFIGSFFANSFTSSLVSTLTVLAVVLIGIFMTLLISRLLSKTILKGVPSSYMLELPPYRKPQVGKILVRSIFDRTLFVLGRAIAVAAPAGLIIWLFANVNIGGISILNYVANFLDPFAKLLGMDGYILTAFILGLPANEIVFPIILMSYLQKGVLVDLEDAFSIGQILIQNGWTLLTAINVMIFTLLHFPCGTTLMTIKKETRERKWAFLAFLLPTACGIILCMFTTGVWNLVSMFV